MVLDVPRTNKHRNGSIKTCFVIFSHFSVFENSRWIIFLKMFLFMNDDRVHYYLIAWPKVRLIIGCRIYVIKIEIDRLHKRVVGLLLQFTSLINVINTSIVTTKEVFISWNWPCMKWSTLRVGRRLVKNVTKNKMKNCSNSKKKDWFFDDKDKFLKETSK